jgi:hypothetical protein
MAADPTRIQTIAQALAQAIKAQGVTSVADLDLEQLAAAADAVIGGSPAVVVNPIDPEGDGLETTELNAANDG